MLCHKERADRVFVCIRKKDSEMKKKRVRLISFILSILLLVSGCGTEGGEQKGDLPDTDSFSMKTAVLYNGEAGSSIWKDTFGYLRQSVILNVDAAGMDISGEKWNLDGLDTVYLDASCAQNPPDSFAGAIEDFVRVGGTVIAENTLCNVLSEDLLGIKDPEKIEGCPVDLSFPDEGDDLGEIQDVIRDFAGLYPSYSQYSGELDRRDYGYAAQAGTAKVLASLNGRAVYTVNSYGEGRIFWVNPLLPNHESISGFSMVRQASDQIAFAHTTAGMNDFFISACLEYAAKQKYGFALRRVFGFFGAPSLSWEMHYEEQTGMQNGAMELTYNLARTYQQVPSFTLVRNTYYWFHRVETVTYLLGNGGAADTAASFRNDIEENAYSSGTHIAAGDKWLSLSRIEDGGSYFGDYEDYKCRAYEDVLDLDGDGVPDILAGSMDGKLYFFKGEGFADRMKTDEAVPLKDEAGRDLSVAGMSAPVVFDCDGDGTADILTGCSDGRIYWFKGRKGDPLVMTSMGVLLDCSTGGQALPRIGDLDGDGTEDLLVGSDQGALVAYLGEKDADGMTTFSHDRMENLAGAAADAGLGRWLSPCISDLDGDGVPEILIGTGDGYIGELARGENGTYHFLKWFEDPREKNYEGTKRLKIGNWCSPVLADLNRDGIPDLVAGAMEYGLAYPIDSPYFPDRKALQKDVNFARDHNLYIGMHYYTNEYASEEREAYEIRRHLEAMRSYGIDTKDIGANQHTWHVTHDVPGQSFRKLWEAGILWNSGFKAAGAIGDPPQDSAENVCALPFFMTDDKGQRTILLENNSTLFYKNDWVRDITAKYEVPICAYEHVDFIYSDSDSVAGKMEIMSDVREKEGYNFVSENLGARASAAAIHQRVDASVKDGTLTICPGEDTEDYALFDEDTAGSLGVRVDFREDVSAENFAIDADVWYAKSRSLYLGLNRQVTLSGGEPSECAHIKRINMPAELSEEDGRMTISFKKDGMMQAVAAGNVTCRNDGWTETSLGKDTMFTRYGKAGDLVLELK